MKVVGNGEGLEVEETDIGGQLVNKGSIEVKAQAGKDGSSGVFGGGIAVEDSSIAKGFVNEGSITLSVTGTPKPDDPYDVIELNGIEIENSTIGGTGIVNSTAGTIRVTGGSEDAKTSGIMIDPIFPGFPDDFPGFPDDDDLAAPSVISKIDNHGTITATGSDSAGIRVNGGAKIGSLLNTGTIDGGTAGIQIEGAGTVLNVTQADGLIKGGKYAINQGKDGSKINLDLAGGKIDGNLDVNDIIVTGEGEIANSKVEAKLLTVKNDGKLTLGNGTTLATDLNLANGTIAGGTITVDGGKQFNVTGRGTIDAATVKADKLTVGNGAQLILIRDTNLDTELSLAGGGVDANTFTVNSINGSGTITADTVTVNSKLLVNSGNQLNLWGNSDTITLNVANGFTVSSGGVLGLELNAGQDSSKPMVDVKGDLTFESGSTVSLSAVKGLKLDGEDYWLDLLTSNKLYRDEIVKSALKNYRQALRRSSNNRSQLNIEIPQKQRKNLENLCEKYEFSQSEIISILLEYEVSENRYLNRYQARLNEHVRIIQGSKTS